MASDSGGEPPDQGRLLNFDWQSPEDVIKQLYGAQIQEVQIEGSEGIHIKFQDERVLVIVGIPNIGIALINPERALH